MVAADGVIAHADLGRLGLVVLPSVGGGSGTVGPASSWSACCRSGRVGPDGDRPEVRIVRVLVTGVQADHDQLVEELNRATGPADPAVLITFPTTRRARLPPSFGLAPATGSNP
jgi:hypothetical protein